jgi:hypothetical protein
VQVRSVRDERSEGRRRRLDERRLRGFDLAHRGKREDLPPSNQTKRVAADPTEASVIPSGVLVHDERQAKPLVMTGLLVASP